MFSRIQTYVKTFLYNFRHRTVTHLMHPRSRERTFMTEYKNYKTLYPLSATISSKLPSATFMRPVIRIRQTTSATALATTPLPSL